MANTTAISPNTVSEDNSYGDLSWTNPNNIKVSDNTYATLGPVTGAHFSYYLVPTNFGFSIPTSATINGILVEFEGKVSITDFSWSFLRTRIVKGGAIKTTNKSVVSFTTAEVVRSAGSSSDLWGETWTPADINASNFGVAISCQKQVDNAILYLDNIRITVYYTENTPTVVTTQAATNIAQTTCTGNGNITATGGANATRRGFCYKAGTSGDPTVADSVAYDNGDFGTGAFTKTISGLSAGTSYRVRAYAVNSAGTSYGSTVDVKTLSSTTTGVSTMTGVGSITF